MVEIAETVSYLRRRQASRAARAEARGRSLAAVLPQARDLLLRRGAEAVFVFGSLARGATAPDSDLDLAVKGLRPEDYFAALGELMSQLPCDVDLVLWEEAPESLRRRIEAEGRAL